MSWSGLENRIQNAGDAASIRLVASRIRNAEKTMANQISIGIYSDGTGSGGRQIDGLQNQVADTPTTGTVGGINRANFTFWQNQTVTVTDSTSATELNADMRDLWIACSRGADVPNVIVLGADLYDTFWGDLQGIQRVTGAGDSKAIKGFSQLEYRGVPVLLDGGQNTGNAIDHGGGIAGGRGYFLNTDYIFWSVHSATNMVPMDERMSLNQDATVVPLLWAGNLTMSNASLQGVLV